MNLDIVLNDELFILKILYDTKSPSLIWQAESPSNLQPKIFQCQTLASVITLYGKKKREREVFANGINSGILRRRDYPRLSGWVLSAIKHTLLGGSEGKFYIQEQRRYKDGMRRNVKILAWSLE